MNDHKCQAYLIEVFMDWFQDQDESHINKDHKPNNKLPNQMVHKWHESKIMVNHKISMVTKCQHFQLGFQAKLQDPQTKLYGQEPSMIWTKKASVASHMI